MYACADCGLCQAHCATDQPLPAAINQSRVEIAAAGGAPPVVYELDAQLKAHGNAYGPATASSVVVTGRTALFLGDAAPHLQPAAVGAATKLLAAAGVTARVHFIRSIEWSAREHTWPARNGRRSRQGRRG